MHTFVRLIVWVFLGTVHWLHDPGPQLRQHRWQQTRQQPLHLQQSQKDVKPSPQLPACLHAGSRLDRCASAHGSGASPVAHPTRAAAALAFW